MENDFLDSMLISDVTQNDYNSLKNEKSSTKSEFYSLPDVISSIMLENKDCVMIKKCSVCGDKALGYNFGAITCESCKAFFRRNALKNKVPPCAFKQSCSITVITRKFCTFCRLMKCYEVKMKKENIAGESSKLKRQKNNKSDSSKVMDSLSFEYESSQSSSTELHYCSSNGQEASATDHYQQDLPMHSDSRNIMNNDEIKTSGRSFSSKTYKESTCSWNPTVITSISQNLKLVSLNDKLSREGLARLMSQKEWDTLYGLYNCYIESFIDSGSMSPSAVENVSLSNLVNSSGFIVRKLINFAKSQSEFTSLDQPCQVSLLKGAVLNSLILRSAVEYDVTKKAWITPQGEISLDLIKSAGLYELYDDYAKYCTNLKRLMGSDNYLISLMQIICLFCYDNSSLTDRQMVSDIHDRYLILLKHYLEAVYGFTESRFRNVSILNNIIELYGLTSKHGQILLHVDPTNVDPLMLEVFNMGLYNSLKQSK